MGVTFVIALLALAACAFGPDRHRTAGGPFSGIARPEAGMHGMESPPDGVISAKNPGHLRLLTYNIQWGMGADGRRDLDRIVENLRRIDADVVLLNEVDINWRRSGNVDQPSYIQRTAGYEFGHFAEALTTWASGNPRASRYGNLLLSRFPVEAVRTVALPGGKGREPRAAVVATLNVEGEPWVVAGTHLGLHAGDRLLQVEALLEAIYAEQGSASATRTGRDGSPYAEASAVPAVVMGDFNARPSAPEIARIVGAAFMDAQAAAGREGAPTFPYPNPHARIDYIFVSESLAGALVRAEPAALPGSDHLPVVVDVVFGRRTRP